MSIDEDELRERLQEGIETNNKRFLINALVYCYHHSEDDLQDAERQFDVGRGEVIVASGSFSEIFEQMRYELRTKGLEFALVWVVGNMFQYFGTDKRHQIITMVEICEMDRLVSNNQFIQANIHLCSYLGQYLKEQNDEQDSNLYYRIQTARDEEVFSEQQERLAQFLRDVRNDAAHNFWLETEWSFVIHEFAGIVAITLLDDVLRDLGITSWPVEPNLSWGNVFRVIEDEFGFEWDEDEREWSDIPREKYQREYSWSYS
ncbi:hypothetical protein C464_11990 [Halorubrum coriense DSM 10284]|uniref:DUF4145 domain-containing protein n=1 Tax=Halorubrum coriense DSM 10284 TaxID=1227466 RepID=M0EF03_9EURY|nr:DUF4145 domain-containing protein [Halorubrum coriense]ELZ45638.1 hypothetical protein C464_11990 [Halorubrum coriense DSM 10284]